MTPLDGALWLVARGFPVFPCDHPGTDYCSGIGRGHDQKTCTERGKHPAVPFTKAYTDDPQQVRDTFGKRLRNVGVPVGRVNGPDGMQLIVMDSDRHGAIEDTAQALGQTWEPTMRVFTGKGHHDYLWAPPGLKLGNGLGSLRGKFDGDVRAGNAYVVGPGSVHRTGVVYELENAEQPPVMAPEWLLEAIQKSVDLPKPRRPYTGPPRGRKSPLVGLINHVATARTERNNKLFWAACRAFEHAREHGEPNTAVARSLMDAAMHAGLSESECRDTIRSAYRRIGQ